MTERLRDSCNSGKMGNSQDHSRTFIHPSVHPSIHPSQDSTPTQMSLASKCLSGKWRQTFGPGHTGDKTNHCWPGDVQRFSLRNCLEMRGGKCENLSNLLLGWQKKPGRCEEDGPGSMRWHRSPTHWLSWAPKLGKTRVLPAPNISRPHCLEPFGKSQNWN